MKIEKNHFEFWCSRLSAKKSIMLAVMFISFAILASLYYIHYLIQAFISIRPSSAIYYYYFRSGNVFPLSFGGILAVIDHQMTFSIYQSASLYLISTSLLIMLGNFLLLREVYTLNRSSNEGNISIGTFGYLIIFVVTIFVWLNPNDLYSWLPTNGSFAAFLPLYIYAIIKSMSYRKDIKKYIGFALMASFFLSFSFNSNRLFLPFDLIVAFVLVLPYISKLREFLILLSTMIISIVFFILSDPVFSFVSSYFTSAPLSQPLVHVFNSEYFLGGIDNTISWVYSVTGLFIPHFEYMANNMGKTLLIVISLLLLLCIYLIYRLTAAQKRRSIKVLGILLIVLILIDLPFPGTNLSIFTYMMLHLALYLSTIPFGPNFQNVFTIIDANRLQRILYEYILAFMIVSLAEYSREYIHQCHRVEVGSELERKTTEKQSFSKPTSRKIISTVAILSVMIIFMASFAGISWVEFPHQNYSIDLSTHDPYAMSLADSGKVSQYSQILYQPDNSYYSPVYAFPQSSNPVSSDFPFFQNFISLPDQPYFQNIFESMPAGTFVYNNSAGYKFANSTYLNGNYSYISNFKDSNIIPSIPVFFVGSMQNFDHFYKIWSNSTKINAYSPIFYDSLFYNESQFLNSLNYSDYIVFSQGCNITNLYFSDLVFSPNTLKIAPSEFTTEPKGVGWYQRFVTNTPQGSYFRGLIPLDSLPIQMGYNEAYGYVFSITPNSSITLPITPPVPGYGIAVNLLFSPNGGALKITSGNESTAFSTYSPSSYYNWVILPSRNFGESLTFVNEAGMQSINLVMEFNNAQFLRAESDVNSILDPRDHLYFDNFSVYEPYQSESGGTSLNFNQIHVYGNFDISKGTNLIVIEGMKVDYPIMLILPLLNLNYNYQASSYQTSNSKSNAYMVPVWGNFMGVIVSNYNTGVPVLVKVFVPPSVQYYSIAIYIPFFASLILVSWDSWKIFKRKDEPPRGS